MIRTYNYNQVALEEILTREEYDQKIRELLRR